MPEPEGKRWGAEQAKECRHGDGVSSREAGAGEKVMMVQVAGGNVR